MTPGLVIRSCAFKSRRPRLPRQGGAAGRRTRRPTPRGDSFSSLSASSNTIYPAVPGCDPRGLQHGELEAIVPAIDKVERRMSSCAKVCCAYRQQRLLDQLDDLQLLGSFG